MRKLSAIALAGLLVMTLAGPALAKGNGNHGGGNIGPTLPSTSSIVLDQAPETLAFGSSATFTTVAVGLAANEYALVYLECLQGATVVYGQLDLPGTTFVLGGGSSPWWNSPGPATCVAHLYAYGSHGGYDTIRELAITPWFAVAG